MNATNNKKLVLLAVLSVIAGTVTAPFGGYLVKMIPVSGLPLSGIRMGIPALLLLPYMLIKSDVRGPSGSRSILWGASFLNAVRLLFFIMAFKWTSLGNAIVLHYLWPVFALLISILMGSHKPLKSEFFLLFSAAFGVFLMNRGQSDTLNGSHMTGSLFMIMSSFIFAGSTLLFKEALKECNEMEVLFFQNAAGALLFVPFLFTSFHLFTPPVLGLSVLYGFLIGIVAFGFFTFGLKRLSMFRYSALTYLETVFGVLLGVVLLSEKISFMSLSGIIIILTSSFISQRLRVND